MIRWPQPRVDGEAHVGNCLGEQVGVAGIDDDVAVTVLHERRRGERAEPVVGVEGRRGGGLRRPGLEPLCGAFAVHQDAVDEVEPRVRLERVLDVLAECRARVHQVDRSLRRRERLRPARRRAREHEPVDPLRIAERELLRDHAAEARPDHVRPLHARLVEHLHGVGGHLGGRVRARRRVALAHAAVVEQDRVERARERLDDGLPAPARVAEPVDQQQRRPGTMTLPGDLHARTRLRRCPRLASPPGTKKTSRMKSVPRMKSGSESGVESTDGRSSMVEEPASAPSRWSASV